MSVKTGKKLGFFAALTMLIGTVVGVGIFFKSHGVLRSNDWNGTGTLLAWIIGGLLSLGAAVSFSEIGSLKTGKVSGLSGYAEIVGGKKLGYFTRFSYSFFYFGILNTIIAFFATEAIVSIFTTLRGGAASDVPVYGHVLISVSLAGFFQVLNYFSLKSSGIVQQVTTVLKWIPLILVAVLGIAMVNVNHNQAGNFGLNAFTNGQKFSFTGMLAALPAVLFAYDSFLNVTAMSHKVKGGVQKLPLIVIVGVSSVVVLYSLIGLSAVLHGSGMVSGAPFGARPEVGLGIFDQIFSGQTAINFGRIIIVFLAISAIGVTNGLIAMGQAVTIQAIDTDTFFGVRTLKKRFSKPLTELIVIASISLFWALIIFVPTIVLNNDGFVDGISNFPTLFFFGIYGLIILLYTIKRNKLPNPKINNWLFKIFSYFAMGGIFFLVAYQLTYGFFIQTILNPDGDPHWGLFLNEQEKLGPSLNALQATITFFSSLAIFFGLPFLNAFLTKQFENNNVFIDTLLTATKQSLAKAQKAN